MKQCQFCGRQNQDAARFCAGCGKALPARQAPAQGRSRLTVVLLAVIAVLAAVLVVLGILLLRPQKQAEPAARQPEPEMAEEVPQPEEPETADAGVDVDTLPVYYITGTEQFLGLRAQPETGAQVLAQLKNGQRVGLVSTDSGDDWYVYSYDSRCYGYARKQFLIADETAVAQAATYYAKQATTLYAGDGDDALGTLAQGEAVTVLARPAGERWYVYSPGLSAYGYAANHDLSSKKPAEAEQNDSGQPVGPGSAPESHEGVYYVSGVDNYLALRSDMAYDPANEIGQLLNGTAVQAISRTGTYWYVYAPTLGTYGYVNAEYLTGTPAGGAADNGGSLYYVAGVDSYLALRSACAYDPANELAKLPNGTPVEYRSEGTGGYWYVYVPSLDRSGYVNSDYLVK